MKNSLSKVSILNLRRVSISTIMLLLCNFLNAQIATYPLRTAHSSNNNTPQGTAQVSLTSPLVVAGTLVGGTSMEQGNYNSAGYRLRTDVSGSTVAWPTLPADAFGFDIPLSPVAGNDIHFTGITLRDTTPDFDVSPTNFFIVPYFQVDGAGPWRIMNGATVAVMGDPSSPAGINFGPVNETFYSGHNYVIRFYVYGSASIYKSDYVRIKNLVFNGTVTSPPAVAPTVTATSATATGLHTANLVGSYQFGPGYHNTYYTGWVYSTTTNPILGSATSDTVGAAGNLNTTLTGLAAGTTYFARAFIITQFGVFYSPTELTFTTFPPTPPIVTTNPVTNILSNKATGGGVIVDSGGVAITSKGLVWNFGGGATIISNIGKVVLNGGSDPFSDFMKQLQPNTNYCYRAFATNSIGTSYGADVCFTTGAPVPVLTAIPGQIDFGTNFFGAQVITVSYILTGAYLNPASGSIAINVPAGSGFEISLSSGSGFGTSLSLPYTGSTIPRTPIFVRFLTSVFGVKSAVVTHSGGGVAAADADIVNLKGQIVQSPDDVSNKGTDFYLGFGYEEKMSRKAGDQDECRLSVYVTNPGSQPVTVHCDLTSGGYAQSTTIPAFGSYTFTGFPMGDANNNLNPGNLPDTRLFSTGISSKSLHVYTEQNIPVAVHMHSYTRGNSAAGSIVFPTNTWNSSYTVQAFGGESNNSNPNSFFFVIAKEDNTVVTFTPTQPILDASPASLFNENLTTPANTLYAANGTYTVTLNKGQVFNAMGGFSPAGNGMDLSGTKVSTTCDKTITVFGGNGRCFIQGINGCTSSTGSDHLIQQMFPSVAWGTKYLTSPTANTSPNYFRIYFQDPTAVVKVNGVTLTASDLVSVNGVPVYYQYQSANPLSITSDKPINVTQFMLTPGCTNSAIDAGPEMIILSPVEQAISSVVFFSPTSGKAIIDGAGSYTSYMNVIIPASKTSTFKLDGVTPPAGSFTAHPQDAGYSYASLPVASLTKHSLTADTGFVAIAYGYGDGESYGFNAGTSIKNLSSIKITDNPLGSDSSSTVVRTCVNTPITLRIALPWTPALVDSVVWQPGGDNRISPVTNQTGAIVGGIAKVEDTITVSGRKFYVYKSPVQFTFSANGLYSFKVTAFGRFLSDCPGQDQQVMLVNVGQDLLNLAANPSCGNPAVPFTADTVPMVGTNILSWEWNFGDGTTVNSGVISPQTHTYPAGPTEFTVKLTTKNTVGCISTDSLKIDFGGGLESKFTISKDSVCANVPVTFTDASTASGTSGAISSWEWVFDNGNTFNGQVPPAQTYTTPGIKTISLTVRTPIGCVKTFKDTVVVEATPVAAINTNPTYVCFKDSVTYQDASTIAVGAITSWKWMFDDGTTSTLQNPKHLWLTTGNHTVKLVVQSTGGCESDTATHTINVEQLPVAGFSYNLNCTTREIRLTDTSNGNGGTINTWNWTFGDGGTSTVQNPTHIYASSGTDTITLSVITSHGCKSLVPDTLIFTIAASPVADFTLPGNTCLPNPSPMFVNTTTISDGTIGSVTYIWSFGDGTPDSTAPAQIAISPVHYFSGTGPYDVKLTAISINGCTDTTTKRYSAIYQRPVAVITAPAGVCLGNATDFSSASSTAPGSTLTGWTWNFGDGVGTSTLQNPTYTYTASGPKTVTLSVTSAAGCVSRDTTVSFSVNLSPEAAFTYSAIRCEDSVITFTDASTPNGAAITEWKWDFDPGTLTQTTQAPATHVFADSRSYNVSLTVKDANGCSDGSPFILPVVINPNPVMDFNVTDICVGTGLANFTQNVTLSSGQIRTWDWNFGVTGSAPGVVPNPSFTYTTGGEYSVTLKATSDSGCLNTVTKTVKAFTAPTVAFDVNNPTSLCSNAPVGIIDRSAVAGYGSIDKLEIYWDFQGAPSVKQTINAPSANSTYTNNYPEFGTPATKPYRILVRAFNGPGCSTDLPQDITVLASPKVQFTQPAPVCQEANSFTLTGATEVFGLAGSGEYSGDGVSNGEFTPILAGAGTHPVRYTYTTTNGCVDFEEKDIVVNPTPIISFGNQSTINILEGDILKLNPTITYGAAYLWTPATYLNSATSASPSGMPLDDIIYNLQVTSDKGCVEDQTIFVKVVRKYIVPNTFTPNNDGNHDVWDIENLKFYPDVRVRVFSRSGQMVFESYGYDKPWDGKFKGQDCAFGTYYYVIETGGGRSPRTGYVTIIR